MRRTGELSSGAPAWADRVSRRRGGLQAPDRAGGGELDGAAVGLGGLGADDLGVGPRRQVGEDELPGGGERRGLPGPPAGEVDAPHGVAALLEGRLAEEEVDVAG